MEGLAPTAVRPNTNIHIDGVAMKDFEIRLLLKRNNLEVSRENKVRQCSASALIYLP